MDAAAATSSAPATSKKTKVAPQIGPFVEFFHASINHLLLVHQIYKKIDNPAVVQYINSCLATIRSLLEAKDLERVLVLILNSDQLPVRIYTFEVTRFWGRCTQKDWDNAENVIQESVLQFTSSDRKMAPAPKGHTFKILLATSEQGHQKLMDEDCKKQMDWMLSNQKDATAKLDQLVSLTAVDSVCYSIQVYAQEVIIVKEEAFLKHDNRTRDASPEF